MNKIHFHDSGWAECDCDNTPHAQGFFPCSQGGSYMEPDDKTWMGYYRCDRCGAIGNPDEKEESNDTSRRNGTEG